MLAPMFTGRCLCGAIRYEIDAELGPFAYCHCTSCRRASGTAFTANTPVRAQNLHLRSERNSLGEYESSAGKFRAFCRVCGSPIYARHTSLPDWLSMRLGLIDQDPVHRSSAHFNVAEKAKWFEVSDGLPQYDGDEVPD
ncbi:MAG: GFA family protein [bacterium]|nr:GFA family protein [bacterium]